MARDALYADAAAQFGRALERLARAYESDSDRRADLLQDIHVALWRSLESFDGRCSMRTWAAYVFIRIRVLDRACARDHQLDLDMLDRMEDRT